MKLNENISIDNRANTEQNRIPRYIPLSQNKFRLSTTEYDMEIPSYVQEYK